MNETPREAADRASAERGLRRLVLTFLAGVALGAAVSFWTAGVLAAYFGRDSQRYELVCGADGCFLLDRESGAVQEARAKGFDVVVVGERAYRVDRSTGDIDLLAEAGLMRVQEQPISIPGRVPRPRLDPGDDE